MTNTVYTVTEQEFNEQINNADAYELFTNKWSIQYSEKIQKELSSRPLPKGQYLDIIHRCFYTCGRGKYVAIYIIETAMEEVINTEVPDLVEERTSYYIHGLKNYVYSYLTWVDNSQWRNRIFLNRYKFGDSEKYRVKVQTTSYSNNSIEFVEKVANNLQKAVVKAKEVQEYLRKNDMLVTDND